MRDVSDEGQYILGKSSVNEDVLSPGASVDHGLKFTVWHDLEFTLRFRVQSVSDGVGTYEGDNGQVRVWGADIPIGGRRQQNKTRTVHNKLTINAGLRSRDTAAEQALRVTTEIKSGDGPWDDDVTLEHPIKITWS